MAITTYKPPEGTCTCAITVGGGETNTVGVAEISSLGAVVGLKGELKRHEYADVILTIGKHPPLTLFAHVVNVRSKLVHLRWLHFEPGEEAALSKRLEQLLAGIAGAERGETTGSDFAWRQEQGTRRIVRPRGDASASADSGNTADQAESGEKPAAQAHKTRRVVRPRSAPGGKTDEAGSSSGTRSSHRQPAATAATSPPAPQGAETEADEYQAVDAKAAADTALDAAATTPAQPSAAPSGAKPAQAPPPAGPTKPAGWRQRAVKAAEDDGDHVALVNTDRLPKAAPPTDNNEPPVSQSYRDEASRKILSRARTVQASELAARHDKVRVLNMSTIKALIKESVAEAVVDINTGLSADRLAEEVEKRVDEQLQAFKAEKDDYEARAKRLEEELKHAQQAVERERARAIEASSFTVSESGLEDLERRLERLVAMAIRRNGVNDALADELRNMVSQILDDERDKIADNARKAQADTIELLERKISRLSSSLTESQKERERQQRTLAAMEKSGGVGLRNVMTAGLDDDDPEIERKKALMKEIIEQNRAMREAFLKEHGTLPGRRESATAEAPAAAVTEAPPAAAAVVESEASADDADVPDLAHPEIATDLVGDEPYDGPPEVDPDDLPWEGPSESDIEEDDRPIKRIAVSVNDAAAKAPPLAIRRSGSAASKDDQDVDHDRTATEVSADDEPPVTASPEVDPDDLPWEPPADSAPSTEASSTIKKISPTINREPPPLERRS